MSRRDPIAVFNNMRTVKFKVHHAKFVLRCRQSCHGPLRKQVRYFREVNRSGSWFVTAGGFRSLLLVSTFWMTVMIMIDGSVKRNRKFGFKLQSPHVIEDRYRVAS